MKNHAGTKPSRHPSYTIDRADALSENSCRILTTVIHCNPQQKQTALMKDHVESLFSPEFDIIHV